MKFSEILVSIIIPYHGNNREVKRLLNTIPDRVDIEVILVNDQVDSKPLDYSHFSLSTLRELKNEPPARWAGASRNTGLNSSRGEFIVFADSDDVFIKNKLVEVLELLRQSPLFCYAICPVYSVMEGTDKPGSRHLGYNGIINEFVSSHSKLSLLRHYVPWGKIYRSSYLTANNIYFEEVIASNDVLFSAKCLICAEKIAIFDVSFYESTDYGSTEVASSVSKLMTKETVRARFFEACKYNEFLRKHDLQDNQVAMSRFLYRITTVQPFFLAYAFCYSIWQGNPIFYDFVHFKRLMNKLLHREI